MNDNQMSVVEHLSELRKRLIWIISGFVVALIFGFLVAGPVVEHIKNDPIAVNIEDWYVFGLSDALRIYMQVAFVIALAFTLPLILYHIWRFVSPGLMEEERKAIAAYIPFSFLLLIIGLLFGYYFLFPLIIGFLSGFSQMLGASETYGLTQYFQFLFNLILPISLLFELPIIILFLTSIRVVNPPLLIKFRKYAMLLSVIVAAMITPPDFISNIVVTIPIIILYEISIILSKRIYRKQLARQARYEEEFATIRTDDD
ncbi:twin arginine-targeting protein translocase TatC [Ammoniphilus oxalaticus]|uniref:Sec-independent protein translocase protein TatC n=1 Tax=Ammoniphilus oxalaticus TaxID=66863 RepID=A0A419SFM9_9BACL|nr:twin-arginine translocase subunit TatC [Ammoniphilus oxalaticus]RKD22591.1 twin arginine-targeting protein translocase TatC [Ammoniphilus oxalaticus]